MLSFLWDLVKNIIGGILTAAIWVLFAWVIPWLNKRKFKSVFGADILNDSGVHLIYSLLSLMIVDKEKKELVTNPSLKPLLSKVRREGEVIKLRGLTTEHPVSISAVRAIKHIAAGVESKSGKTIISSDHDLANQPDISFISFGGAAGNDKTGQVFEHDSNDLVILDQPDDSSKLCRFASKTSRRTLRLYDPQEKYDYGLILKIKPSNLSERVWFVCAGFGEWGTSGAAWYLANKWKEIYDYAADGKFAVIVRIDPKRNECKRVLSGRTPEEIELCADQWERQHKEAGASIKSGEGMSSTMGPFTP